MPFSIGQSLLPSIFRAVIRVSYHRGTASYHCTVSLKLKECTRLLLSCSCSGSNALMMASDYGQMAVMSVLLKCGAQVDVQRNVRSVDHYDQCCDMLINVVINVVKWLYNTDEGSVNHTSSAATIVFSRRWEELSFSAPIAGPRYHGCVFNSCARIVVSYSCRYCIVEWLYCANDCLQLRPRCSGGRIIATQSRDRWKLAQKEISRE